MFKQIKKIVALVILSIIVVTSLGVTAFATGSFDYADIPLVKVEFKALYSSPTSSPRLSGNAFEKVLVYEHNVNHFEAHGLEDISPMGTAFVSTQPMWVGSAANRVTIDNMAINAINNYTYLYNRFRGNEQFFGWIRVSNVQIFRVSDGSRVWYDLYATFAGWVSVQTVWRSNDYLESE